MTTRVLLTIDTEFTWRHFRQGAGWRENFERSFDPAGVGVPYQLERLRRHGLKACFFVDPMPALVYGIEPIRTVVASILDAGQEVQLHLHSFWYDLANGRGEDARFKLTRFDADEQRRLIGTARDLLIEAGAAPPTAFRSGSFAANPATLDALRHFGLRFDSSHNGATQSSSGGLALDPELMDPVELRGVIEVPVSKIRRGDGGLRPLQICALSSQEMEAALVHAESHDHSVTTIVCHSFELATRDAKRVNGLVRGRFDRLCAFLEENEGTMPTIGFADVTAAAPAEPARPLPARALRTARRVAEQAWGTARYESRWSVAPYFGSDGG